MAFTWLLVTILPLIANAIQLPSPDGKYGIGFRQHILPKHTPNELLPSPDHNGTFLLLSVYYPTASNSTKPGPYFDAASARIWETYLDLPSNSLTKLTTALQPDAPFLSTQDTTLPTIVFTPGLGNSAFQYYGLISHLAANGYTVLALDHPYEPAALLLPDGTTVRGLSENESGLTLKDVQEIVAYRISDQQVAAREWPEYVANVSAPFNTSSFVCIGHSIGGAAAASATAEIPGAIGGANFDGTFWPPYLPDVKKPFLTMLSSNHTWPFDVTLPTFAERQSSWWSMPLVYSAYHNDYSDEGMWPQLLGLGWTKRLQNYGLQVGPIGGMRAVNIVRAFVMQFLSFVQGGDEGILLNPSSEWWEVVYLNGSSFDRPPYIVG